MPNDTIVNAPAAGNPGSGTPNPGAGSPPAPAAAVPAPSAVDWITGIQNAEIRGFVQQKGFKDPEVMADSYRNLEKLMGAPKERLLKLPEKFDTPEGEQVWQRLGKPEKADGYGLEAGKDAKAEDKAFVEWAKDAFHKSNLTSEQAKSVIAKFNDFQTKAAAEQSAAAVASQKQDFEGLKTAWGNAYDQKLAIAQSGAKEFGLTPEQIDGIQKNVGYQKTMELFHNIGSKVGESQFVNGQPRSGNGPMDVSTALAAVAAKKADAGFMTRYMSGDAAAKAEFGALLADAYPGEMTI